MTRVVLASGSPRRRELLAQLGVVAEIIAPDIDESVGDGEDPLTYVLRLAAAKAAAVVAAVEVSGPLSGPVAGPVAGAALVIAADTTVVLDGVIFGKPDDVADARRMLGLLSGRTHLVHSGVAVSSGPRLLTAVVTTAVTMVEIGAADLEWYLTGGEPFDKAGAYALQGAGGTFVERIDGSVSNVIGLPLHMVVDLARQLGVNLLG